MKIISNFSNYLKSTNESLYFKLNNKTYGWVNDDKDDYINTSMFKKEDGITTYRAIANKRILSRSGVITYNLYDIKDFNATKSLKHNLAYFNDKIILKPDHTITDFKNYTVDYIIRLLNFLDIDIDIILTPKSSSDLNKSIINLLPKQYFKLKGKELKVIDDAFVKTPKDIKIDKDVLKQSAISIIENEYGHKLISTIRKNELIDELYSNMLEYINMDNLNDLVEPYYIKLKKLNTELQNLDQYNISNYDKIDELENQIKKIEKELKTKYPNYEKTVHYNKKNKEWEVKKLPDIARYALSNMQGFSKSFNDRFIVTNKDGNIQSDKTILYTGNEKILIFDDNLASGVTVDDICMRLIENGVDSKDIIVITLGLVPENKKFKITKKIT